MDKEIRTLPDSYYKEHTPEVEAKDERVFSESVTINGERVYTGFKTPLIKSVKIIVGGKVV